MRRFAHVLAFELGKALHSRLTWVTVLLPAALAAISVLIGERVRAAARLASQVEGIDSAYVGFSQGASNGFVLGAFLLLFYSSMLVANEGHLRTFKTILMRAHSRLEWIGAKLVLLLILSVALLVAVTGTSALFAAGIADFADIAEEGYVIYEASFMADEAQLALLLVIPSLVALASFGLMVSTLTDHTGIATSACIGTYIFLEALKSSMLDARLYLFNTFMPSLLDTSYFAVLRGLADGLSDAGVEPGWVSFNVITPLVSAALFSAVAAGVLWRRDVAV